MDAPVHARPMNNIAEDQDANLNAAALDDDNVVYEQYQAAHVRGVAHPGEIVSTASLASIPLPPLTPTAYPRHPDVQRLVDEGTISDAQAEVLYYSNMRFHGPKLPDGSTPGFFLGDGAGVGKGRAIASCAINHYRNGGDRILWVSVSNDLRVDARRDLDDLGEVGYDIPFFPEVVGSGCVDFYHHVFA